ncbi:MAG: hypothetical protein ACOH2R_17310 [Pseudomonas sp.]
MATHRVNITGGIVRWAKQHDWYISHIQLNTDTALHYFRVTVRDDHSTMGIRHFENYEELRNWAGY